MNYEHRIIIAGHRRYDNYKQFKHYVSQILKNIDHTKLCLISGDAPGADTLTIQYARDNCIPVLVIGADWKLHGKSAGPKRNLLMAQQATHLIAFLAPGSKGTKSMINIAKRYNLETRVINIPAD